MTGFIKHYPSCPSFDTPGTGCICANIESSGKGVLTVMLDPAELIRQAQQQGLIAQSLAYA